ncbi:putative solute carrier family 35 member C2 [Operophtera brumata]|uniref:Putative solute carrier family 35 member C2 n=1 Tax=Operophtera brumata TaxID=104452 RepID=A0A0L7LD73_OPEBR|nr:putative solute carrier family 35 member C2 [Operophtera brumata]
MGGAKYEQLSSNSKADEDEDVLTSKPRGRWSDICLQKSLLSLGLILLYFSLSIGLTFYQRWLLKWILSIIIRLVLYLITGTSQLVLPFMTCVRSVGPTGLASGIDVGFSNWGLELSWSLVGIVLMIAIGLIMFTYKATQFNFLGFNFLLLASFAAGLRWTFAQLLMQKSKLGLHNPVDMVFHVQPWIGDLLSPINVAGLAVCLLGITAHIVHKVFIIKKVAGTVRAIHDDDFDALASRY